MPPDTCRYPQHGAQGIRARYATKRTKDYELFDGEGLYLLIRPNGSKLWGFKYRFDGKEKLLSLGRYPELSLAEARLRRAEFKVAQAKGIDPGAKEVVAPVMTFEEAGRALECHVGHTVHASARGLALTLDKRACER
ncbi:Arm DNA-binding domain-containing protein [Sphingomonas psychrotolerans]|uniref:Arm DNA-binding domain-containing protein n=1 Tax=Sphingomonas psychrotolerans TaxID=1327635 RepID=A0ABU3N6F6_9SPHN|nr:Arm DNA-binding domain-containing protein [Sphingomonas psychrotolerans]MDT8759347.1 Arm DNA-binding domain-containing protein [Sphingomonas psychrotolerans]